MNAPLPVEPRLIAGSVRDEDTGCLIWMRSANSRGYGLIGVDGHVELAHRAAYTVWVGPIPDGLQIDHVYDNGCRSKLCIEPSHLEAVTNLENQRRSLRARKTHCLRNHPLSGDNVRVNGNGHRSCVTCRIEAHRRETAKRQLVGAS